MSTLHPLLIELGTEELPVKALRGLAQAFFDGVLDGLHKRGIAFDRGEAKPLYSPRRLAVLLPGVAAEQPEQTSEVLGPYLNIALDAEGKPTKALQGFAQKAFGFGANNQNFGRGNFGGAAPQDWTHLERTTDAKGERFVHRAVKPGAQTRALLGEIIVEAIAAMPIPKPMRWGDHDYGFARPVHWLVLLLGKDVVDASVLGVRSDRMSRGHRFMHDKPVWIGAPSDYVEAMRAAHVLVDPDERRQRIVREVEAAAGVNGGVAHIDAGVLEEVNGLTEWPKAIACSFEREFLAVPQEALIATMQDNQKFFPVLDAEGKLSERFIGIANIESRDESEVRKGYERVIRPRFADAQFFFVEDLKQGLAAMGDGLKTVTYQAKLGSVADKVARVAALAEAIAGEVGVDPKLARRAAELSKNDLQSRLVNEFPELQGIAGRYYAVAANEPVSVAEAVDEAYMPRFAGDAIAPSKLGQVLAIAERLDTLAGGFAAGLKPTGNKDAFALRRNALGLARTIIESNIDLSLDDVLAKARDGVGAIAHDKGSASADTGELREFILDRLRGYYADRGIPAQQFTAVAELKPASLLDFDRRLKAIGEFSKLPEADALAAANKRIRNMLRGSSFGFGESNQNFGGNFGPSKPREMVIHPDLLTPGAERELAEAVEASITDTDPLLAQRDYVAVLGRLARLRPQVDGFFDSVMVNVDDLAVRNNRLALLKRLSDRLGSVAAIEQLSS